MRGDVGVNEGHVGLVLRNRGVVHNMVGCMSWHCYERFISACRRAHMDGRHVIDEWQKDDGPVTCLRCLLPYMKGGLESWM